MSGHYYVKEATGCWQKNIADLRNKDKNYKERPLADGKRNLFHGRDPRGLENASDACGYHED
jgi:hypothetical protein